jgi:Bacterial membrane protein YfhO
VSSAATSADPTPAWTHMRRPWGWGDGLALLIWTAAIAFFFRDALFFGKALFYFDITEINYPYRDFLAKEMKLGRFSRWMPGLYCGFPLYSESQAGYLHPLKPLLYPWMETWRAFNLDVVLSVWLAGLATFGWLRRHVGPAGALTGAALFGLSGFVWAHLIHTSMNNALISVPLAIWALEAAWDGGRLRGVALGALALACQVFAGHLQDTILTAGLVGLYALHRALTEPTWGRRARALGLATAMVGLGMVVAALQWIPSKELLDRSPRAGGLTWDQLTYGSWSPELLPTLVIREAYGTRARNTDWPDGYYPYHEMNAYMGLLGLALAAIGAGATRDRWVSFWIVLAMIGGVLMLGRYTFVFDYMNRVPVLGSSRIPVRYHLWVSMAVAALAAVGVDRLSRPGRVRLGGVVMIAVLLVVISLVILILVYEPAWSPNTRWTVSSHVERSKWLVREVTNAAIRLVILGGIGWGLMRVAARSERPRVRRACAALLPILVITELLWSHSADVPTIDPAYWTVPPPTVDVLKADPTLIRIFGLAAKSSGEPGYASHPVDFMAVRDSLAWSLAPVWGLSSSTGETPINPLRMLEYTEHIHPSQGRFVIESVSHILAAVRLDALDREARKVGTVWINKVPGTFPRARLAGRPYYASDERAAIAALESLGGGVRERLVVEDPDRPLAEDAKVNGTASIVAEQPEALTIETSSSDPSYLVLSDSFDPGWSAKVDGHPAPIRPAYIAFRAVYLPAGPHRVDFKYRPAGFRLGLILSSIGLVVCLVLLVWPRRVADLAPAHALLAWPRHWPLIGLIAIVVIVAASTFRMGKDGSVQIHPRWQTAFHKFTWGAGIEAIPSTKDALGR